MRNFSAEEAQELLDDPDADEDEEDDGYLSSSLPIASSDVEDPTSSSTDTIGPSSSSISTDHWSVGLPPSSPPPISSPILTPQSDDNDYAASDAYSDDLTMCLDELSSIFTDPMDFGSASIEQQTQSLSENGVADFDFSQFWESVKPLVGGGGDIEGDVTNSPPSHEDQMKLAEDLQALFDGCLV